jgi:hypothetical protein
MSENLPRWITDIFTDSLDHVEKLHQILHVSMRGISVLRGIPNAIEVLNRVVVEEERDKDHETKLKRAKEEAALAEAELNEGFPLLHAQTAISVWATLEALVRTLLANWLSNQPEAKDIEELKRVKIRYGEYEALTGDDRNFYILDLLEDSLGTRRRAGIGRFESLFQAFGLSSEVDADTKKNLFELYHVRNVLVHRRGIADRKLVDSCPWLDLSVNSRVVVSHAAYRRYHESAASYILELIQRVRVHFGHGRYESEENANTDAKSLDADGAA